FLGLNNEPAVSDTSFVHRSFTYIKPTTAPGKYYIFYRVDLLNAITEMREYDNTGYFEIIQRDTASLPYYNDFEQHANDWDHNASLGTDQWEWATPQGSYLNSAFSGDKGLITNPLGNVSGQTRMHLFTPIFD